MSSRLAATSDASQNDYRHTVRSTKICSELDVATIKTTITIKLLLLLRLLVQSCMCGQQSCAKAMRASTLPTTQSGLSASRRLSIIVEARRCVPSNSALLGPHERKLQVLLQTVDPNLQIYPYSSGPSSVRTFTEVYVMRVLHGLC